MYSGRLNGKMITEVKQTKGITHYCLAGRLGVSPSLLSQMEQGYLPPRNRERILGALAAEIGVSVAALFLPEAITA